MKTISSLFLITLVLLLSACGEGGIGGTGLDEQQPVISYGVLKQTGQNEITVQNRRYKIDNANIEINNTAKDPNALRDGMIAKVEGSQGTKDDVATASSVEIKNTLSGQISQVIDEHTVVVLGQVVNLDTETNYENPNSTSGFSVGMQISVMGFVSNDGEVHATYINNEETETEQSLSGYVASLDTVKKTFLLGDILIDYSSAGLSEQTAALLADGVFVEVEGSFDIDTKRLTVTQLQAEGFEVSSSHEDAEAELEGLVAKVIDGETFVLLNTTVKLNNNTVFKQGSASDIKLNAKVHVKGVMKDKVLQVSEIETEVENTQQNTSGTGGDDSTSTTTGSTSSTTESSEVVSGNGSIVSVVTMVNNDSLVLAGLADTQFKVVDSTVFDGVSALDQISVDATVEISAEKVNDQINAKLVRLKDNAPTEDVTIKGDVEKIESPKIWVFGSVIDMTNVAVDGDDLDAFLNKLSDKKINLQGKINNSTVEWQEADYF